MNRIGHYTIDTEKWSLSDYTSRDLSRIRNEYSTLCYIVNTMSWQLYNNNSDYYKDMRTKEGKHLAKKLSIIKDYSDAVRNAGEVMLGELKELERGKNYKA